MYKRIEFVVKKTPNTISQGTSGPDEFTGEFYQLFKEEIMEFYTNG
jgi:hypothetical protein